MLRACIIIIIVLNYFVPFIASASTCATVAYQIDRDINKYEQEIQTKKLPWMSLSWLQRKLGPAKIQKTPNQVIAYKWRCPETSDSYIAVFADVNKRIFRVEGFYSLEIGGALFSTNLTDGVVTDENGGYKLTNNLTQPTLSTNKVISKKTCSDLINQIDADYKKYFSATSSQNVPKLFWMDLTFLAQILGQPQVYAASENLYQWNNFSLFKNSAGLKQTLGDMPAGLTDNSVENIVRVLGPPKLVDNQELNQYYWICTDNHINASLSFLTDKKGKILTIGGQNCIDNKCNLFQFDLGESDLKQKFRATSNRIAVKEHI